MLVIPFKYRNSNITFGFFFTVDCDVIRLENESFDNNTCSNCFRMAEYVTYFLSYDLTTKIITDFIVKNTRGA